MIFNFKITVHEFSTTFKTWAEEQGKYQNYTIKFPQSYQLSGKVETAYIYRLYPRKKYNN